MKKTLIIAVFIFWLGASLFITAGLFFNKAAGPSQDGQNNGGNNLPDNPDSGNTVINAAEVAKHSTAADCWMIISNKVYNLTPYFNAHPGGAAVILKYCGQDGSVGYETKDYGQPHSEYAKSLLSEYFIANLNQTIISSSGAQGSGSIALSPTTQPTIQPAPKPAPVVVAPGQSLTLNIATIGKHNKSADCWMIINGKVYNLTPYVSAHPGGAATILKYCGQDGTIGFQTKDLGRPHSQSAQSLLAAYLIGNLNQTINSGNTNPNPPAPTPVPTPVPAPSSGVVTLNAVEVAKHNKSADCWMIINNKVYGLTSYIPAHPGGSAMVPYCGRDGTAAFSGLPHSSRAVGLLAGYLLGDLNSQATVTPANPSATPAPNFGGEDENEFEDD